LVSLQVFPCHAPVSPLFVRAERSVPRPEVQVLSGVGAVLRSLSEAVALELIYGIEVFGQGLLDAHGDELEPEELEWDGWYEPLSSYAWPRARVLRFARAALMCGKNRPLEIYRVGGHDHRIDQYIFILNYLRISVINIVSY